MEAAPPTHVHAGFLVIAALVGSVLERFSNWWHKPLEKSCPTLVAQSTTSWLSFGIWTLSAAVCWCPVGFRMA